MRVFKRFLGRFFDVFRGKYFSHVTFVYTTKTRTKRERRENLVGEERVYLFRDGGGEHSFCSVFFVGRDREVRRYLFHTYHSEIESNGSQILGQTEW
jgi:hypothetical protein